jgi:hypothetical protein
MLTVAPLLQRDALLRRQSRLERFLSRCCDRPRYFLQAPLRFLNGLLPRGDASLDRIVSTIAPRLLLSPVSLGGGALLQPDLSSLFILLPEALAPRPLR